MYTLARVMSQMFFSIPELLYIVNMWSYFKQDYKLREQEYEFKEVDVKKVSGKCYVSSAQLVLSCHSYDYEKRGKYDINKSITNDVLNMKNCPKVTNRFSVWLECIFTMGMYNIQAI